MSETLKILIVEDEWLVAADIAERLTRAGYHIAGISDNAADALSMFKKTSPDLVLLDINIKGDKDGIALAGDIAVIQPTPFIYLTAHADAATVQKAKNTFPAAYLIKPFTTNLLLVSIELALHNFACNKLPSLATEERSAVQQDGIYLKQLYIFIKDGYRFVKLFLNDILYIEAEDNYVRIVTLKKNFLIRTTLVQAIKQMGQTNFVRVHRSFCVNINHVSSFSENELCINDITIPIGRNYKEEVMQLFHFR